MVWQTYQNLDGMMVLLFQESIGIPKHAPLPPPPPNSGTLYQTVLRVHYTSLQWKSAHSPSPQLPDPEDYAWK